MPEQSAHTSLPSSSSTAALKSTGEDCELRWLELGADRRGDGINSSEEMLLIMRVCSLSPSSVMGSVVDISSLIRWGDGRSKAGLLLDGGSVAELAALDDAFAFWGLEEWLASACSHGEGG